MDAGRRVIERRLKRGDLGELLVFTDDYMTLGTLPPLEALAWSYIPGETFPRINY